MKDSGKTGQSVHDTERRHEPRSIKLANHRAEFKFPGFPIYQLKLRDISAKGAGVVVRADSNFLTMIRIGQELNVNLLLPRETGVAGNYKSRIEHISELNQGRFKGHMVVGISILNKLNSF
jgi:c-di-GMP-binding flagellar brake protein YcgR